MGGEKEEKGLFRGCCWCFCHVGAENMKKEERVKSYEGKEKKKKEKNRGQKVFIHRRNQSTKRGKKPPLKSEKQRNCLNSLSTPPPFH